MTGIRIVIIVIFPQPPIINVIVVNGPKIITEPSSLTGLLVNMVTGCGVLGLMMMMLINN